MQAAHGGILESAPSLQSESRRHLLGAIGEGTRVIGKP